MILLIISLVSLDNFKYKSIIISLIFCIQILIFALEKGLISNILKKKLFLLIGKLSYSIYLVHYSILFGVIAISIILSKFSEHQYTMMINDIRYIDFGNAIYNNISIVIILGIIIFISNFTYKYIEQKGQKLGKTLKKRLSTK